MSIQLTGKDPRRGSGKRVMGGQDPARSIKEIVFERFNSPAVDPSGIAINSIGEASCILYERPSPQPRQLNVGALPNRIHLNTRPSCPPPPFDSSFHEIPRSFLNTRKALRTRLLLQSGGVDIFDTALCSLLRNDFKWEILNGRRHAIRIIWVVYIRTG